MEDIDDISDDGKNLWSNLLQEVKEKSSKTRHIPNSLLVLGNDSSGKSSLIARLQNADPKNGVGLEFEFIDVKDESMDENKQLNVWISSGDTFHSNLLKYALDESNFEFTLCMITVSISEPWAIMESLEQWLDILKKQVDRLKLELQHVSSLKESLSRHFQEYVEPEVDNVVPIVVGKRRDPDFNYLHPIITEEPDKINVPLGNGVFDKNLGLPIIVVITKTDQISNLEEDYHYDDDKFDFIQMNIRRLCLKYGAALCYTSLKDGRNCELLLRYVLHRCYGFPFIDTASVIEKDAIFIPAGWDNTNKINILAENLPEDMRNQTYDVFVTKPLALVKAAAQIRMSEPEMPEDEQVFLMKQQAQLQRIKAATDPNLKPDPTRAGQLPKGSSVASSGPVRSRKNLAGQASVGANNPNPSAQGNEGVLANFFSSLLNKRAVPGEAPLPGQQSIVEDSNKQTDNVLDSQKISKDDLKVEDIPDTIIENIEEKSSLAHMTTNDMQLPRLEENVVDEGTDQADEVLEKVVSENKDETRVQETASDDYLVHDDDIKNVTEELKSDEIEADDENSTGKQFSELEYNAEGKDENISEIKLDEENVDKSEVEIEMKSLEEPVFQEETKGVEIVDDITSIDAKEVLQLDCDIQEPFREEKLLSEGEIIQVAMSEEKGETTDENGVSVVCGESETENSMEVKNVETGSCLEDIDKEEVAADTVVDATINIDSVDKASESVVVDNEPEIENSVEVKNVEASPFLEDIDKEELASGTTTTNIESVDEASESAVVDNEPEIENSVEVKNVEASPFLEDIDKEELAGGTTTTNIESVDEESKSSVVNNEPEMENSTEFETAETSDNSVNRDCVIKESTDTLNDDNIKEESLDDKGHGVDKVEEIRTEIETENEERCIDDETKLHDSEEVIGESENASLNDITNKGSTTSNDIDIENKKNIDNFQENGDVQRTNQINIENCADIINESVAGGDSENLEDLREQT